MIRTGKLCGDCSPNVCRDCPSELEPALIVCPQCEETGCESCGFSGRFEVKECPQKQIESGFLDFVEMAACFKKGLLPVEGGVLDQDSWFVRAARFLDSQESISRPSMED